MSDTPAHTPDANSPPESHDPVRLGREVVAACTALGFAAAGISPARSTVHREELLAWLREGRHGAMDYLEADLEARLDIRKLLPGARAVIMVADQYASRSVPAPDAPVPGTGRVARYAQGRDYHDVIRRRLHALADALRERFGRPGSRAGGAQRFRAFVDTAPVLEREHAAAAGLGWIGKHTLLIHPCLGSYLLLGGIATTLDIAPEPDAGADRELPMFPVPDHCGGCTRCIDACPTQAITPYSVDGTRCISYLTLEHPGRIDLALHRAMGDRILGCDICQDVCPHNAPLSTHRAADQSAGGSQTTTYDGDRVNPLLLGRGLADRSSANDGPPGVPGPHLPLRRVLDWTEADRRASLSSSAAKRASLDMIRRNAVIAAANSLADPGLDRAAASLLRERLCQIAADTDESPLLRQTARDCLDEPGTK